MQDGMQIADQDTMTMGNVVTVTLAMCYGLLADYSLGSVRMMQLKLSREDCGKACYSLVQVLLCTEFGLIC